MLELGVNEEKKQKYINHYVSKETTKRLKWLRKISYKD